MASKNVKFYDTKLRKVVSVPEAQTKITYKKARNRTIKMRVATGKAGNLMYRIVG